MVTMTDKTKQKILDAALTVFAKEGYKSATTRSIAEESGFTEMTLFRKFDTKENLFDAAIVQNNERFQKDFMDLMEDLQEFDSSREFLETYIKRLENYFNDNFEFLSLMVNEDKNKIEIDMGKFNLMIGNYLQNYLKSDEIDSTALGFLINTFLYRNTLEKYKGRRVDNDAIEKLIDNISLCIK